MAKKMLSCAYVRMHVGVCVGMYVFSAYASKRIAKKMSSCAYVRMYVRMCVCVCMYECICIHKDGQEDVQVGKKNTCMSVCMLCEYVCMYACIHKDAQEDV